MAKKTGCSCTSFDTLAQRLGHLRRCVEGATLREFAEAISAKMEDGDVSYGAVNNYETPGKKEPRADYLVALSRAFPSVRMEWLLFGRGAPFTSLSERLDDAGEAPATPLAERALGVLPRRSDWGPTETAAFNELWRRYAAGCPEDLSRAQELELAEELDRLILRPLDLWGFRRDLSDEELTDYVLGMVSALVKIVPEAGEGDPAGERFDEEG